MDPLTNQFAAFESQRNRNCGRKSRQRTEDEDHLQRIQSHTFHRDPSRSSGDLNLANHHRRLIPPSLWTLVRTGLGTLRVGRPTLTSRAASVSRATSALQATIVPSKEHYPELWVPRSVVAVHPKLIADEVFDPANTAERTIVRVDFPWTLGEMLGWRDGKWKEALPTQPPRKEIRIQIVDGSAFLAFGSDTTRSSHKSVDVANEEGIRMGDVVAALRRAAYHAPFKQSKDQGGTEDDHSKRAGLRFSLERYQNVSFDIEPAVLPEGEWVEGAVEEEERARDC